MSEYMYFVIEIANLLMFLRKVGLHLHITEWMCEVTLLISKVFIFFWNTDQVQEYKKSHELQSRAHQFGWSVLILDQSDAFYNLRSGVVFLRSETKVRIHSRVDMAPDEPPCSCWSSFCWPISRSNIIRRLLEKLRYLYFINMILKSSYLKGYCLEFIQNKYLKCVNICFCLVLIYYKTLNKQKWRRR